MLERASREMLDSPYFYGSYILLRIARADPDKSQAGAVKQE